MILVLGKSALSVPDTRFSRVSGSTLVFIMWTPINKLFTPSTLQKFGVSKIICSIYAFIVNRYLGRVNASAVGRILYAQVLRKISTAHSLDVITRMMPFLLQSGCLGDNRALHLSSVLYSSGFGIRRQPYKVCVFWVMWQSGFSSISFTCLIVIWTLSKVNDD